MIILRSSLSKESDPYKDLWFSAGDCMYESTLPIHDLDDLRLLRFARRTEASTAVTFSPMHAGLPIKQLC